MQRVNVHEAKTHLSRLLDQVSAGSEIVISKAGRPVAKLVPFVDTDSGDRAPGALKGRVRISSDFDAPLPEEVLSAFAQPEI